MKKVLVAMSGGVDSSVVAALLKKQGFAVQGLFIFFESLDQAAENLNSAKKVAGLLDIPLQTLDLSAEFEKEIIADFVSQYQAGKTPNPCVRCNQYFKFGYLLNYARQNGFDFLATGHYARVVTQAFRPAHFKLITARDKNKDQSYFLYNLNQNILPNILFPLANLKKNQVKKLAKKFGLPVYDKKESFDVCFIRTSLAEFLNSKINSNPGDIVDLKGKILGRHNGLAFYTLGQRQGIKIGGPGPYYVVEKKLAANQLVVTNNKNDARLFSNEILVKNINWISNLEPKLPLKCLAQHRYQTKKSQVEIFKAGQFYQIKYKKPQRAITPGQSIVFYQPLRKLFSRNYEVLGGGVIESCG
jgi:tRNA-specific 2-thiouridylase